MDHKFSEIDHETPLFKFFLVVHLQTHSAQNWLFAPALLVVEFQMPHFGSNIHNIVFIEMKNVPLKCNLWEKIPEFI